MNQAMKDFKEVCDFKEESGDLVLIPKKGIDIDKLGYEFYNYILGLMKNI